MLSPEKYFEYLKDSIPPFLFKKEASPIFDDLVTTVQDFNYYFGELREYQRKVVNKKDITIISVAELLKHDLEEKTKEWLKQLPPDELFIFDTSKLGTKIRRAFENTIFRVSIYRDNVTLIVNELGYFWLREEPRHLLPVMLESRRILLFPELSEILNELKKLEEVIGMRNKITHKTHLKIELQLKKDNKSQEILTETYESSSPIIRALERRLGKVKTIDYYIEKLESLYPVIGSINKKLAGYYCTKYDRERWRRNFNKLRRKNK
jgi:hypothetical protein